MAIKTLRIIGMGAVGMLIGHHFREGQVSFLLDEERYQRYTQETFTINGLAEEFQFVTPKDASAVDLLIVATKYNGLFEALKTMESSVDEHTIIISILNGIISETIIREHFPQAHVLHCVAQGMDAMKFGTELTYKNQGQLCIGIDDASLQGDLEAVQDYFDAYQFPYTIEEDIMHRLYSKFMLNVGINQTCHVFHCGYGDALKDNSLEKLVFISAMREAQLLANLEGVAITEDDLNGYVDLMASLEKDAMPSMAQDRINQKPSEVELFAGTIKALAKKHHVHVPVNDYLYDQVKAIEAAYGKDD